MTYLFIFMPSPFARSLPSNSKLKNVYTPILVCCLVVILVGYLFLWKDTATTKENGVKIKQQPIETKPGQVHALLISSGGKVSVPGSHIQEKERLVSYTTAGLERMPIFFLVC